MYSAVGDDGDGVDWQHMCNINSNWLSELRSIKKQQTFPFEYAFYPFKLRRITVVGNRYTYIVCKVNGSLRILFSLHVYSLTIDKVYA